MTDAIQVAVRVRPLNKQEVDSGQPFAWNIQGNSLVALDDGRDTKYALDHVFGPEWTTQAIFEKVAHGLLHKVISGFNSTVFAYGQTSSGKTFTMRGTETEPGIIPLAVHQIFRLIEAAQDREFLLRVSYMELYNEEVNDLLAPQNVKLPVHESKETGVYVCGLREDIVTSPEAVLSLLETGENNRHIGSTKMNEKSSRSHTLFRMVVESRARDSESVDAAAILVSTLTLVDLAGSERVAKTGAEGLRMKEGTAINKSLLTLGNVINKLSEGVLTQGGHIPYRDSKLTRILQPSLGGNAKTAIIAAMTPAACHLEESHSTLRFACRAKRVVNNAVVNEVLSDAAVLKRQAHEIEELKKKLAASGMSSEVEEQIGQLRSQLLHSEQEKELMRIKLEEEKMEREKAQKQVEVARKMMFESGMGRGEEAGVSKRNSRRETWCPGGKVGWSAPPGAAEAMDAATLSSARKRPLSALREDSEGGAGTEGGDDVGPVGGAGGVNLLRGSTIFEGDEEGEDGEGGTGDASDSEPPQRRRRDSRHSTAASQGPIFPGEGEDATEAVLQELTKMAKRAKSAQERSVLEFALTQWRSSHDLSQELQAQVATLTQLSDGQAEDIRAATMQVQSLTDERDQLLPALEKERWQQRQLEKRLAEATEAHSQMRKERDALTASLAEAQQQADSVTTEMQTAQQAWKDERATLREQAKALQVSLKDAQDSLALDAQEKAALEAKVRAACEDADTASRKMQDKMQELEAALKQLEDAQEELRTTEARCRDLTDANKRLEAHVTDLESRKRPPLYQKKQEEELRAANEKAAEADARAHDMETKAKECKAAAEAAERRLAEVEESANKAAKLAAQMASDTAEKHTLELQKLSLERAKLIAQHDEQVAALEAQLRTLTEELNEAQSGLKGRDETVQELRDQVASLQQQSAELEATQGELQACLTAASDRIAQLEQDSEAAATAHEQQAEQLRQELTDTKAAAAVRQSELEAQLSALQASLEKHEQDAQAQLAAAQSQHAEQLTAAQSQHEEQLAAAKAALEEELTALKASKASAVSEAARVQEGYKAQIDGLNQKLIEAAGALRAKEELKEERLKHKQETSALKSELQKLQLESKTGAKGKEMAAKEVENLKKRVTDLDTKLKTAMQDKTAAVQEKAKLEAQVKQYESQKQLMTKTLEKQGAIESKKRESIMVNLSKKSEALSSVEDRLKSTQVELQKCKMDLEAKGSECQSLEQQVSQLEASLTEERNAHNAVSMQLTTAQHNLECLQAEHKTLQANADTLTQQLDELRETHARVSQELSTLQTQHAALTESQQRTSAELASLTEAHTALTAKQAETAAQLGATQQERDRQASEIVTLTERMKSAVDAQAVAEDARIAAESRLPEIDELQRQLTFAHEQLSDMQFAQAAQQTAATQAAQEAAGQQESLRGQIQALQKDLRTARDLIAADKATAADLQQQLDQAVELYTAVQGESDKLRADWQASQEQLAAANNAAKEKAVSLDSLAAQARDAETHIAELEQAKAALTEQVTEQSARVDGLQAEIASLNTALQAAKEAVSAAEQRHAAALADAKGDTEFRVQELQTQLDQMTQEMTDLDFNWNQERAAAAQQLAHLQAQLDAARAAGPQEAAALAQQAAQQRQAVEAQLTEAVGRASALQGQLAAAERVRQEWEQRCQAAQTELGEVQQALRDADARHAALDSATGADRASLAAMQQELASFQGKWRELQQQTQVVIAERAEAVQQLQAAEAEIAALREQLSGAQLQAKQLQDEVMTSIGQITQLQEQLTASQQQASQLQAQLSAAVEQRDALVSQQQQQAAQVGSGTLLSPLPAAQPQRAAAAQPGADDNTMDLLGPLGSPFAVQAGTPSAAAAASTPSAPQDGQLAAVQGALSNAQAQTAQLQSERAALQQSLGQLRAELSAADAARSSAEARVSELTQRLNVKEVELQDMATERMHFARRIQVLQQQVQEQANQQQPQQQPAAAMTPVASRTPAAQAKSPSPSPFVMGAGDMTINSLAVEAAEAQAAANRALAEKQAMERDLSLRICDLEREVMELRDALQQAQQHASQPAAPASTAAPVGAMAAHLAAHPSAREEQLARQVTELQTRIDNVSAARAQTEAALQGQVAESQSLVSMLESELSAQKQQTQALEQELASARTELAAAQALAESRAHQSVEGDAEAEGLRAELTQLRVECTDLCDREARASADLSAAQARVAEVSETLRQCQTALSTETTARQELAAQVRSLEEAHSALQTVYKEATQSAATSQTSSGKTLAEMEQLHATIKAKDQELWTAQDSALRAQRALADTTAQLKAAQSELSAVLPDLERYQQAAAESGAQLADLQSQLASAQSRAAALADAMRDQDQAHRAKLEAAKNESQQLTQERDAMATSQVELQARLAAAGQQIAQLQQQLEAAAAGGGAPQGPTLEQQALLTRMAQRLEALEAGHREAIERMREEVQAAGTDRQAAEAASQQFKVDLEQAKRQHAIALEEAEWAAKSKEAEMNAKVLSLESQIHWLGEQNAQLEAAIARGGAAAPAAGAAAAGAQPPAEAAAPAAAAQAIPAAAPQQQQQLSDLETRCSSLESELRKSKRAELKMQALLFRLRKDVEDSGGNVAALDTLREKRSLEYDVDTLTQKLKRAERQVATLEAERKGAAQAHGSKGVAAAPGGAAPRAATAGNVLADKENQR